MLARETCVVEQCMPTPQPLPLPSSPWSQAAFSQPPHHARQPAPSPIINAVWLSNEGLMP